MDTSSAYMLFYEREGLCQHQYMPSIAGKTPDTRDLDDDFDSDLKKLCCIMWSGLEVISCKGTP
jgi:ubiquitin carboxyl-terminal hydrolase 6/32